MIKTGTWKTRNNEIVYVDYIGEDYCSGSWDDVDENGELMGCIELTWNLLGNDLAKIKGWDLVQLVKEAYMKIVDGSPVLFFD